jgi:hypothetical protein
MNVHGTVKTLQSHYLVDGIPIQPFQPISLRQSYLLRKMPQPRFLKSQGTRTLCIIDLVHSDICGQLPTQSLTMTCNFISFIDDYSQFTILYFFEEKNETFQVVQTSYKALLKLIPPNDTLNSWLRGV